MELFTPTSRIKRFISSLPTGQIFATRDCLNFGPRTAIDKALWRMVQDGTIIRLTWGVFVRNDQKSEMPSQLAIAKYKAKAFFRRIEHIPKSFERSELLLKVMSVGREKSDQAMKTPFATDGATTSFLLVQKPFQRQRIGRHSPRKLLLADSLHGLVIRRLWKLGCDEVTKEVVEEATALLGRTEREALQRSCHIMPAWLANKLVWKIWNANDEPEDDEVVRKRRESQMDVG